jgi:hypothetical protein
MNSVRANPGLKARVARLEEAQTEIERVAGGLRAYPATLTTAGA